MKATFRVACFGLLASLVLIACEDPFDKLKEWTEKKDHEWISKRIQENQKVIAKREAEKVKAIERAREEEIRARAVFEKTLPRSFTIDSVPRGARVHIRTQSTYRWWKMGGTPNTPAKLQVTHLPPLPFPQGEIRLPLHPFPPDVILLDHPQYEYSRISITRELIERGSITVELDPIRRPQDIIGDLTREPEIEIDESRECFDEGLETKALPDCWGPPGSGIPWGWRVGGTLRNVFLGKIDVRILARTDLWYEQYAHIDPPPWKNFPHEVTWTGKKREGALLVLLVDGTYTGSSDECNPAAAQGVLAWATSFPVKGPEDLLSGWAQGNDVVKRRCLHGQEGNLTGSQPLGQK